MFPIVSVSYRGTEMKKHHSCPKGSHGPVETEHFKDAIESDRSYWKRKEKGLCPGRLHTHCCPTLT